MERRTALMATDRTIVNIETPTTPAPTTVSFDLDVTEGVAVVHVRGEIDVVTAPEFEEAIESARARHRSSVLIVDLTKVAFLASAGLAVLARCSDEFADRGRFLVVADSPATRRPLELTGLDRSLELFPSIEAALATV